MKIMFGFLDELAKGVGNVIGTVTGPIIGLSVDVIATALSIPVSMVKEAIDAGCESYEEIKRYHNL